jgi:hypothetical protein
MMKSKPLSETNSYLKDPERREKLIERSVASSCGVEGIKVNFRKMKKVNIPRRGNKKIYKAIPK